MKSLSSILRKAFLWDAWRIVLGSFIVGAVLFIYGSRWSPAPTDWGAIGWKEVMMAVAVSCIGVAVANVAVIGSNQIHVVTNVGTTGAEYVIVTIGNDKIGKDKIGKDNN